MSSIAVCDRDSLSALGRLVNGPLRIEDLPVVERLLRTLVLHDRTTLLPDGMEVEGATAGVRYKLFNRNSEEFGLFSAPSLDYALTELDAQIANLVITHDNFRDAL